MAQELTYKWIQDRLRDLHAGKLSAQDKARLESIALQDPFVADALEGFEAHPDATHEAYLAALEEKIRHAPRERRRWLMPNLTVTAIAASVILIIATYAVISRMDQAPEEALTVILDTDSLGLHDSLPAGTVVWSEGDEGEPEVEAKVRISPLEGDGLSGAENGRGDDKAEPTGEEKEKALSAPIASGQGDELADQTLNPQSGTISARTESAASEPVTPSKAATTTMSLERALDEDRDMAFYANQMDPALMARRVTGRVVSSSGDPLTGADIRVAGTNLGVTSGDEGRFELYLPLPQNEVEVFLPGYGPARVQMQQGETDKDIVIEPFLAEAGAARQQSVLEKTSRDDKAAPAGAGLTGTQEGIETWNSFLMKNSRFPLRQNFYLPGKEVTVQFTIRANGKATNIRILRSSGDPQLDKESVRLIGAWDHWQCEASDCTKEFTLYFE